MDAISIIKSLGLSKTKQRIDIIEAILKRQKPFSPGELCEELSTYDKSTVYRFVTLLLDNGIIQQLNMPGTNSAYYMIKQHKHFAVCKQCKDVVSLNSCPIKSTGIDVDDGFTVTDHDITLYGFCEKCKE